MVAFIVVLIVVRDHRRLQRYTYTSMLVGVLLLAIPSILPARFSEVNGARNWIRFAGFSIQPGEFAKILLVIFVAGFLVAKRDALALASHRFLGLDLPRGRDLGPIIVAWLVSVGLLVRGRDDEVRFHEINPLTAMLVETLQQNESLSGTACVEQVLAQAGADAAALRDAGLATLRDLRNFEAILGTAF